MQSLTHKIYAITGAGHRPGIGSAAVQLLLDRGAKVIVNSRNFDQDWYETLSKNQNVSIVMGDITDQSCQAQIVEIADSLGGLDGLINNASTGKSTKDSNGLITVETWQDNFLVNCTAVYHLTHACHSLLKKSNGSVMNIASRAAVTPGTGNNVAYAISKAALVRLTEEIAKNFSPEVTVNSISPGLVESQRFLNIHGNDIELAKTKWKYQSGMNRSLLPSEVAEWAIACMQQRGITGQNLIMAGVSTL